MKISSLLGFKLPEKTDNFNVGDINYNFQNIENNLFTEIDDDMADINVYGFATPSAVVKYLKTALEGMSGQAAIEWELLETQTLEASATEVKLKLADIKDYRGARVKVIIPSGTDLVSGVPNVKAVLPSGRSLLTRINYVKNFTTSAPTIFYFDVLPKGDVWNFDVFPYSGMLGTTTGDIRVDIVSGKVDRIEYMVVAGSSSNQLPAGTVVEYWGLK